MNTANIALTKGQAAFIGSKAKYPLFCAGYAAGKSHTMGLSAVLDAMHGSNAVIGVYEPFHDLIRTVAWPNVQKWLVEFGVRFNLNKQESVIYTSSSGIGDFYFKSMDNVEALVGYETYTSHIDELDTMSPDNAEKAFFKIMGRNRQVPNGVPEEHKVWVEKTQQYEVRNRISTYTTPEGFKFCYKMWGVDSDNAKRNPEFKLFKGRTQDNPTLTEDYIQGLKSTYPAALLAAYMEGEFINLESGSVYYNFNRLTHSTGRVVQKNDILHIGVDFNVNNTCGIPAHRVICYPDSSGTQRTAANASTSSIALLKAAGFEVRAKKKNPLIKDRVASVVKMLEEQRLFINVADCPETTKCLEQQAYDDKGQPDKDSGVDHPLDGLGYRVVYSFPITKPVFEIPFSFAQKT